MKSSWWATAPILIYLLFSSYFLLRVDRAVWLDEAFSLETARIMQTEHIDFSQYDVHPPLYYHLLNAWMSLPHQSPEWVWGRLLSLVLGVAFFKGLAGFFCSLGYERKQYAPVLLLLALNTTLIYYATQVRMYMLEITVAAWAMYAVVKSSQMTGASRRRWSILWIAMVIILPFIQYFAVAFYPPFLVVQHMRIRERNGRKFAWIQTALTASLLLAATVISFILYALPQIRRIESLYLLPPGLMSYPSSLFYAFHFTDRSYPGWWGRLLLVGFVATLLAVLWLAFLEFRRERDIRSKVIAVMLLSLMVIPLSAFAGVFFEAYHHRYFLVISWMFSAAFYLTLFRKWGWKAFIPLVAFNLGMAALFLEQADTEMKDMSLWFAKFSNCSAQDVVHETAGTYLVFETYKREWCRGKGPGWNDWLSTELTEKLGRSDLEAAIDQSRISRGGGTLPFGGANTFYIVHKGFTLHSQWFTSKIEWIGPTASLLSAAVK